jgi:16S rRNA (adenine1518-N6/adenine1519-N6)-dimethyltransferase
VTESGSALLGPADIRALAARLDVRPAKRLGQNFVIDAGTIRKIVALAKLSPDDVVLEVGPGLGSLTLGLLDAAGAVIAVEVDPVLSAELPLTAAARAGDRAARLTVVTADAVTISAADLPGQPPVSLVANLPYNVAVPVLLNLLDALPTLSRAVVMVQAEVADRICAPPGSRTYGVPSVKIAWYGKARRVGTISRTVFWPVPNVDSALVEFTRTVLAARGDDPPEPPAVRSRGASPPGPHAAEVGAVWPAGGRPPAPPAPSARPERTEVFDVIDAAFSQRRKTLRAALAPWAGSADAAERVLREAGIDPALRGEAIGVPQYIQIAAAARAERSIIESWRK